MQTTPSIINQRLREDGVTMKSGRAHTSRGVKISVRQSLSKDFNGNLVYYLTPLWFDPDLSGFRSNYELNILRHGLAIIFRHPEPVEGRMLIIKPLRNLL